ncbi:hypothetical protein [Polyangium aurulentum]|uniref:hypothetical protein n=1 Tax=Polyangium aurulentum TaxID=2567896 RepID=UPI0010ADC933|nr:hypothetical protein [Polyangium aurulentum]UQA60154.1 hypothetical protein E8A73_006630 [Polyangium aurulentum]
MADTHIDYFEVFEYGEHFLYQSTQLVGLSKLVDIAEVQQLVDGTIKSVAAELEKAGVHRSDKRVDRKEAEDKTAHLRKEIERFHKHLGAVEGDAPIDAAAFFPGKKLGPVSAMKPADLAQKAGEILRGFAAPANDSLPDGATWKARIESAQAALVAALAGKETTAAAAIQASQGLAAAREAFLVAYNGVAKRLVLGLLASLDRKDELPIFFKDLQVNERRPAKTATAPAPAPTV